MAIVNGYIYEFSSTAGDDFVIAGDLLNLTVGVLLQVGRVAEATTGLYTIDGPSRVDQFAGADLAYDTSGRLIGGTVTGWEEFEKIRFPGGVVGPDRIEEYKLFSVTGLSIPATTFASWIDEGYVASAPTLLAGDDSLTGPSLYNVLWGYAGNDTIARGDSDFWSDEVRGGEGKDLILGGDFFDDINGNQGDDTIHGGVGDDLAHGGKDNDLVFGNEGNDRVFGDLGDDDIQGNQGGDTLEGGDGSDTIHGGQGPDVISGGVGADWLSGDRGDDTISGGGGADVFHTVGDAGIDRVTDFNPGEGDRVRLDPGSAYQLAQAGADTVITLGGGAQMILAGVQLSSLPAGWIFEA